MKEQGGKITEYEEIGGRGLGYRWHQPGSNPVPLGIILLLLHAMFPWLVHNRMQQGEWHLLELLISFLLLYFVTIGWLTYLCVALIINRSEAGMHRGRFRAWHGPLPFWGRCVLPLEEVDRILVTTHSRRRGGKITMYHTLKLKTKAGKLIGLFIMSRESSETTWAADRLNAIVQQARGGLPQS